MNYTDHVLTNHDWKIELKLSPKERFSFEVEKIAQMPEMNYMQAVIIQASIAGVDLECVSPLLTIKIKRKIRLEATKLNMMKK